ncbi:MAG: Alkaline serine protease [candidate division WWE3 bacterium GW2011_GWB2_43_22]|uniref:Alkaline serine protease n=1 Tax=candidate division WWE3 bacterium GW2011_GWB2_43_22 TaxID=1619118 RepID=A0A0G1EKF6_UNCKA|nr:MAG: Alkaline serine protease [candidate division WWE3 bacterium GW2011_GWB2_43_22]
MKAKFVVFIVVLVVLATTGAVLAESYQESSCGNYVWVEFPGPLGESASWNTTDKAVLTTRLGFYSLVDRAFIIGRGDYTLAGVPANNTWGCFYTGGYYPPQSRVDEIVGSLNPAECIFVSEEGTITVNTPVNGSCVLPEPPPPTVTPTVLPTEIATETETVVPTVTQTETPTPEPSATVTQQPSSTATAIPVPSVLQGGVNTVEKWNDAVNGSDLIIVTGYAYDIVLVAYTEPDTALNLRIGVEKEDDPNIQKGTGTFSWNLAGYWDLVVASNAEGVVEVVVHVSSVVGLPGKTHFVSAGYGDQTPESWQATVSSGGSYQVFLPLITR